MKVSISAKLQGYKIGFYHEFESPLTADQLHERKNEVVNAAVAMFKVKCSKVFLVDFALCVSFEVYFFERGIKQTLFLKEKEMKHFTIEELCKTNTGLDNTPNADVVANLRFLVENVLDPLRDAYGKPITVNCGYRSPAVNTKVGGVQPSAKSKGSQHLYGQAADITTGTKEGNKQLYDLIIKLGHYDQVIDEKNFSWVHVSYTSGLNRKQALKM